MIKNKIIPASLMMFLSQLKSFMKNVYEKKKGTTSKTPIAEPFSEISNRNKNLK